MEDKKTDNKDIKEIEEKQTITTINNSESDMSVKEIKQEEKKEKKEDIDKIAKETTIDRFRYWLIVPFILEKISNHSYWSKATDNKKLKCFIDVDKYKCMGYTAMIPLENMINNTDFEEIYIVPQEFINYKNFFIAFIKLSVDTTNKYIHEVSRLKLWELQNDIFLNIQKSKIFGTEIENLLGESPILLYIEPIEDNLLENDINNINKILGIQTENWSMYDCHLAQFHYWVAPWDKLIFINTKKFANCETGINVPYMFLKILEQITSYKLLRTRKNLLDQSILSKFELQDIISTQSLKETYELHKRLTKALGQFSEYDILLMEELPKLKELNKSFLDTFAISRTNEIIAESEKKCPGIFRCFENDISAFLNDIGQDFAKLSSKAKILSSYSNDKLNVEISYVNLKLQKRINFLTIVIAILTLVLVLESDLIKKLISFVSQEIIFWYNFLV